MLELEWVGSDRGRLDSGTLSVLSLDKKHTKVSIGCVINAVYQIIKLSQLIVLLDFLPDAVQLVRDHMCCLL